MVVSDEMGDWGNAIQDSFVGKKPEGSSRPTDG